MTLVSRVGLGSGRAFPKARRTAVHPHSARPLPCAPRPKTSLHRKHPRGRRTTFSPGWERTGNPASATSRRRIGSDYTAGTSWPRRRRSRRGGKFLAQFQDVLVILLLVATAISAGCGSSSATRRCPTKRSRSSPSCCSTRSWATSRSREPRRPWRRCAQMSAAHATVIRDGERRSVPAAEIVPGDIILDRGRRHHSRRRAADRVGRAADRRGGADRREPAGHEGHRADRRGGRRSATATTWSSAARRRPTGTARAVVTATGMQTEMGRIAGLLEADARRDDAAAAGARPRRQDCSASSSSSSPS